MVEADLETSRRGAVSIDAVLGVLAVAWGAIANSGGLTDNSFFTHLATGRIILDTGSVPTADPYSFTAAGEQWTVQSWIPSLIYATAERMGGVAGLRIVGMMLGGTAAWLIWRLTRRCESLLPRLALLFGALAASTDLWGIRPYMFGVIGLGLVWLVLDQGFPAWALVPVFWIWANSHGSFPLGLALIVLFAVGSRIDGHPARAQTRALAFGAFGTVAAAIGPLGIRALTFPATALERQDVLRNIQEWKPAEFVAPGQRVYLVLVAASLLCLVRRPSWQRTLPAVVFVVAGMMALRNLPMSTVVLVPVIAAGVDEVGSLRTTDRPRYALVPVCVLLVSLLAAVSVLAGRPLGSLDGYPGRPIAAMEAGPLMVTPDYVGNLLEVLDGEGARVFIDDRVDMFPRSVLEESSTLIRGRPQWRSVLDRWDVDVVLWDRSSSIASLLASDEQWRTWYSDERWMVACRRGTCPP